MLTAVIACRGDKERSYKLPLPATDTEWAAAMRCIGIEAWDGTRKNWYVDKYLSGKSDPEPLGALGRYETKERLNAAGQIIKQMDGAEIDDLRRICMEEDWSWENYPIAPLFVPDKQERADLISSLSRMVLMQAKLGKTGECPDLARLAHITKYAWLDDCGCVQPLYDDEVEDIVMKTKSLMLRDALTREIDVIDEELEAHANKWRLSTRNSRQEKAASTE